MNGPPPSSSDTQAPSGGDRRVHWRVVVRGDRRPADGQNRVGLAWHLASCTAPSAAAGHCPEGLRLLEADGNPDGHCLVDGGCPRCAAAATPPGPPADGT